MLARKRRRSDSLLIAILITLVAGGARGQGVASLRGQITDQLGGTIAGATVSVIDEDGREQSTSTDDRGMYRFTGLRPGQYRVRASQPGFAARERREVALKDGYVGTVDLRLTVTVENQKMTVSGQESLSTDSANNKNALSIRGQDLDSLPDDPDELAMVLSALSGPAAGVNNILDVYLDGFTTFTNLPPDKRAIREIVINRNPFSAEYDRIGFGRVDISTRPGTGKIHGGADFNFSDDKLNSRNPYSDDRAPYQRRIYSGNLSGPLASDKASAFFSFTRREINEAAIIDAAVLDAALNPTQLIQAVPTPQTYLILNPRFDFQLNKSNTISGRYTFNSSHLHNLGIGAEVLPSAAFNDAETIHTLQFTGITIVNPRIVNEVRLQFLSFRRSQVETDSSPALDVLDAFTGGGAQIGNNVYKQNYWEIQDYLTMTAKQHTFKFGGRLRGAEIKEQAPTNFGGIFVFAGGRAPLLDTRNRIIPAPNGQPQLVDITSLESYRRTLVFQQEGLPPSQIRALGGGAAQLTIAAGDPLATLNQIDFGGFVQDDWKVRPGFTLSMGLRYQNQTNIQGSLHFAPRVAFAWTPWSGSDQPATVIRGGVGIFYDLVRTALPLQVSHLNGINQKEFIVTNPQLLDLFPMVPSTALLSSLSLPETIWQESNDITAPYYVHSSISVERSLPHNIVLSASYLNTRGVHLLRSRVVTAPAGSIGPRPGSPHITPSDLTPNPNGSNNIYAFESTGVYRQNLLMLNAAIRPTPKLTLNVSYGFGHTNSDTDLFNTFPANSNDLGAEYGRSAIDIRHRCTVTGTINAGWGISLNPFVLAQSGLPFNITTGVDSNNDSLFLDRPAFAMDLKKPSVRITPFGAFDTNPGPGQKIIPRNFGQGPGYFSVNLRIGKSFVFGDEKPSGSSQSNRKGSARSYKLTVGVYAANLFNHNNPARPIGNLASPLFGTSDALQQTGQVVQANNRTVSLVTSINF